MKTYEPSEKVEFITEAEWQDRVLHGPQYGPGAEQSKTVLKTAAKTTTAVVATAAIVGTGGAATPFVIGGIGATLAGEAFRRAGEQDGNEVVEWIGDTISSVGINVATSGLSSAVGAVSTSKSLACNIVSETVKKAKEDFEYFSLIKDGYEFSVDFIHAQHKDKGISYDSDCYICNK
jgi:hypothetical protein